MLTILGTLRVGSQGFRALSAIEDDRYSGDPGHCQVHQREWRWQGPRGLGCAYAPGLGVGAAWKRCVVSQSQSRLKRSCIYSFTGEETLACLAKATQRFPENEDLCVEAFLHYIRAGERKLAQQVCKFLSSPSPTSRLTVFGFLVDQHAHESHLQEFAISVVVYRLRHSASS
jgi:hypothetical protein